MWAVLWVAQITTVLIIVPSAVAGGYPVNIEYIPYWPTLHCHILTAILPLLTGLTQVVHASSCCSHTQ